MSKRLHRMIGLALISLLAASAARAQDVFYVDASRPTSGDGLSWQNAKKYLQEGIDLATPNNFPDLDQVWVADGTYWPSDQDQDVSFHLEVGVEVYGGYRGFNNEQLDPDERDILLFPTILSGELGVAGFQDNSKTVVKGATGTGHEFAVLDGFTVTGAKEHAIVNDNYSSPLYENLLITANESTNDGAGMFNGNHSSPMVFNCTFSLNTAWYWENGNGGAMANYDYSSPNISSCTFIDNEALMSGGAMYNGDYSAPFLTDCTFTDNTSSQGGAMCNQNQSNPSLTDCAFVNNTATQPYGGGGMYNSYSSPTLRRVLFEQNQATNYGGGGGMLNWGDTSPVLIDCTFYNNSADYMGGGGLFFDDDGGSPILEHFKHDMAHTHMR